MEIVKASWVTDEKRIRLNLPISKVDVANRLVSGFATLDNVDSHDDVVTADASAEAFSEFRGNLREMHQPIAAGRVVDFMQDSYYDPNTEHFYNGIWVTCYVSLGAQDTWEKVLDGTLSGFSIGGEIIDANTQYVPDLERSIRFIIKYNLIELSLVDNPANQLANVFSITKKADGTLCFKGMAAEVQTESVFWCQKDEVAKTSADNSVDCTICGSHMQNIGWFEFDGGDKTEKVKNIVALHIGSDDAELEKQATTANNEGGVNVADEQTTDVEETTETVEKSAEVDEVTEVSETIEKAADVSEVEVEEPDFAKMFGDLQAAIESGLAKNSADARETIAEVTKAFDAKFDELAAKHDELTNKFAALEEKTSGVEKALDSLVDETAVKKSNDLGGSREEELEKNKSSKWGGRFLTTDLL
jgi:hypothetical protein